MSRHRADDQVLPLHHPPNSPIGGEVGPDCPDPGLAGQAHQGFLGGIDDRDLKLAASREVLRDRATHQPGPQHDDPHTHLPFPDANYSLSRYTSS